MQLHYNIEIAQSILIIDDLDNLPGDKSEDTISDAKSLSDEYDELVLSAPSESDPLSSEIKHAKVIGPNAKYDTAL